MVIELKDGGMGSIKLHTKASRRYAKDLMEVSYQDSDGILVIIALTEDNQHELFELDIWKVDFSKLIQYPTPDKIIVH